MITGPTTGAMAVVVNTVMQLFNAGSSFLYTTNNIDVNDGTTPTPEP